MDICLRVLKESNKSKFDGYCVRNSVLIVSHITFRDCSVHTFFPTTFLEIAVYNIFWRGDLRRAYSTGHSFPVKNDFSHSVQESQ